MTLNNFGNNIEMDLLGRGHDYYAGKAVEDLEETEPGLWLAVVQGSENYSVIVKIDKAEIKDWECDCPYDHGPICKHVIAVFYAISDEKKLEKTQPKSKQGSKNKTDQIFEKISEDQLEVFVKEQFKRDRSLKNSFIAHFAELIEEDLDTKYKIIVRNLYKAAEGRQGFIDYRSTGLLTDPLFDLLKKAEQLWAKKDAVTALAISKTMIEEVPVFIHNMDDSNGEAGGIIEDAFDIFHRIAAEAPPMLKDELFEFCFREYPKEKYHDFGFEDQFLETMPLLATTEEQENRFFELIDRQIEKERKKGYSDYGIVSLLKSKIYFLKEHKRDQEANDLIEANSYYSEFRGMLVDKEISNKRYDIAQELCLEGIEIAKGKGHPGTEDSWQEKLLEIAEKEEKIDEVRKWAEILYFGVGHNMNYYKKLKATYGNEEWPEKCEEIINKLKGKNQRVNSYMVRALANIFVEEKFTERLLKLLQLNAGSIFLIESYAKHLQEEYPLEILDLYEKGVRQHVVNTGRGVYNEAARYMKKMEKMEDGKEKVGEMIQGFKVQYKMRRAMMEVLKKKFPDLF